MARRNEHAVDAVHDHAAEAGDRRRDHRDTARHRLEQHDAEALAAGCRSAEDVRGSVVPRQQLGRHTARELDVGDAHRGDLALVPPAHRTVAHHDQARVVTGATELAVRLQQRRKTLARLKATDEEDRRLAGRAQLVELGMVWIEPRAIDPVRDNAVVPFEIARDEISCRDAHRHVNMEAVEVALEEGPSVVVAEVAARHGMEGADVRAAVEAQHGDRQRWHERLVGVDDVEVVLVEQGPNPPDQVERQRDARHRAVGAHRDAAADAHVPGDAVVVADAARRCEHGYVVATRPQLRGEVADMLGHPPRVHEVVRGDETDLHRGPDAGQMGSRTCHCSGCSRMAASKMRSNICAVLRTSASLGASVAYRISGWTTALTRYRLRKSRIGTIAAPARMAISTDPMGIGAGLPKNSSGSPLPMRSRSSAMATTPPDRSTL